MIVLALALSLPGTALAASYGSAEDAYADGVRAIESRDFTAAFEALEWAAERDSFDAKFALAQLYSSDALPFVDHAKAYRLYSEIAERYRTADSYYNKRSPFVARSLVAVALYKAEGLAELDLAPDIDGAIQDLDYASKWFDDMDAQLELVKIWLKDDSNTSTFRQASDLLLKLAREKGHPGAQATLAEMFFSGDSKLGRRPSLALGFATLAVEGAYDDDRLWIDSVYHRIYCDTAPAVRVRAHAFADRFRKDVRVVQAIREARRKTAIGKITEQQDAELWGSALTWLCANGESVVWPKRAGTRHPEAEAVTAKVLPQEAAPVASLPAEEAMGLTKYQPAGVAAE